MYCGGIGDDFWSYKDELLADDEAGDELEASIMYRMSVTWKCIKESTDASAVGSNRCLDHLFRTERMWNKVSWRRGMARVIRTGLSGLEGNTSDPFCSEL